MCIKAGAYMQTKASDEYITNREWFRDVLHGEKVILRGVSALEYLEMFVGYLGENQIDVYSTSIGMCENINYHIVDDFSKIDFFQHKNILCCNLEQALNDLFSDFDNADEQAIVEALSTYYHTHDNSFDGLNVYSNKEKFEELKGWATEFYNTL